ncbi:hypothetical protein LW4_039 [Lactococcus phage LW4]|uniref:Uncharacterized protein n=4 Tax=Teubervirus LW31 TaxID=2845420 RepID=A0A1W6JHX7_9CAUD|nr:hypothetical protein H1N70_gp38 [Lactococcus phage LW31]ARM65640.1 hypothetical protein LW31_038 [Lactococcus phage LW31]ARM65728.1 hypothetical protein LW32_041 [Lactococcus phage LW32]ARM65813.1 hypothetical protein LW33_039 [Lactococcus phage LW33]ARM65899.1 hypothetical protein LW4_039 [Lactococcus phage LW4]
MLKNIVPVTEKDFVNNVKTIKDITNTKEYKERLKFDYAKKHTNKRKKVNKWNESLLINSEGLT